MTMDSTKYFQQCCYMCKSLNHFYNLKYRLFFTRVTFSMSFLLMTSFVQSYCFLFKRNEDQNDPSFSQRILLCESDSYIVPDLSEELLGKSFSVGVTAGLPIPELLLLLDRCWTTGLMGRIGGGLS